MRDEKPLFDLAQQLRTAVETNREEGGSRVEEVAVTLLPDRRLSVSAPVERDGAVYGLLQADTAAPAPRPARASGGVVADVAKIVLPLLVLLWLGFRGERTSAVPAPALAAVAGLLLARRSLDGRPPRQHRALECEPGRRGRGGAGRGGRRRARPAGAGRDRRRRGCAPRTGELGRAIASVSRSA